MQRGVRTEIKVGLLVLITAVLAVAGYQILQGYDLFGNQEEYYVVFDAAGGLEPASPVTIKGMQVGKVLDIHLAIEQNPYDPPVIVLIGVDKSIRLTHRTKATLISMDLLGTRAIELTIEPDSQYLNPGDTIYGSVALSITERVAEEVAPVKMKAERLMASLDSLIETVGYFLKGANKKRLERSMVHMERSLANLFRVTARLDTLLRQQQPQLQRLTANLNQITGAIAQERDQLRRLIANLAAISDTVKSADLAQTVQNLNHSLAHLDSLLAAIQAGQGTLGQLATNDSLYQALTQTLQDLDSLIVDIKARPYRYVHVSLFGPSPKKIHKWEQRMARKAQRKAKNR